MKAEIKKEYDPIFGRDFYHIYINDKYQTLKGSLDEAKATLENIKLHLTSPQPIDTVIYSEEF